MKLNPILNIIMDTNSLVSGRGYSGCKFQHKYTNHWDL